MADEYEVTVDDRDQPLVIFTDGVERMSDEELSEQFKLQMNTAHTIAVLPEWPHITELNRDVNNLKFLLATLMQSLEVETWEATAEAAFALVESNIGLVIEREESHMAVRARLVENRMGHG